MVRAPRQMRLALYISPRDAKTGACLRALPTEQMRRLRAYCARRHWEETRVYEGTWPSEAHGRALARFQRATSRSHSASCPHAAIPCASVSARC